MPRGRARKEKCLLKGKADEFVNGYCHGGVRAYRKSGREYEANDYDNIDINEDNINDLIEEDEDNKEEAEHNKMVQELHNLIYTEHYIMEEMDIDSPAFKQLLVLNDTKGYIARTRCTRNIFPESRKTDEEDNEAGWINEYWFGKVILPNKYGIVDWEPSIEKYYDLKLFDDPWDFRLPNLSVDVKTQAKGTYAVREYICPESKLYALQTDDFAIWWSECKLASDVIKGRDSPMPVWKYYENKKTIWDTYNEIQHPVDSDWKFVNYMKVLNPKYPVMKAHPDWNTTVYTAILKPPTAGDFTLGISSNQLYFSKDVLEDYNP